MDRYNEEVFMWNMLKNFYARLVECYNSDGYYYRFRKSHRDINPVADIYGPDEKPDTDRKTLLLDKRQVEDILASNDIVKHWELSYVEVRQRFIHGKPVREIYINGIRTYCIR